MPSLESLYASIGFKADPSTFPTLDKLSKSMDDLQKKTINLQRTGLDALTSKAVKSGSYKDLQNAHNALDALLKSSGGALTGGDIKRTHIDLDERMDLLRRRMPTMKLIEEGEKQRDKEARAQFKKEKFQLQQEKLQAQQQKFQLQQENLQKRKEKLQKLRDGYLLKDGRLFERRREFWSNLGSARMFQYALPAGAAFGVLMALQRIIGGVEDVGRESIFSKTLELDPRRVGLMERAFSPYGISSAQTKSMISNIRSLQAQAAQGYGKGFNFFSSLGVRPYDPVTHKLLPIEKTLDLIMKATSGLPQQIRLQRLAEAGIGPEFFFPLKKGIYGLEGRAAQTFSLTDADYEAAQKFTIEWGRTKQEIEDLTTLLSVGFLPILTKINDFLQTLINPPKISKEEATKQLATSAEKYSNLTDTPMSGIQTLNAYFTIVGAEDPHKTAQTVHEHLAHTARKIKTASAGAHG